MAKFNTGQSFADGDTVTGAKLNNIIGLLDIYSGVIADQTSIAATVSTADLLLIADTDAGSSGAANKVTIQKLLNDTLTGGTFTNANISEQLTYGTATGNRTVSTSATITTGTIPNLTAGTTTSTVATITNGTITTAVIPTLTTGTTTSTAQIVTSGTTTNLNSTTGTIATLNSTTGTIGNLSTTLVGDFTISQGTGTLATSGATAGTYGSVTAIPFLTIDAKGRITSATTGTFSSTPADGSITPAKLSQPVTSGTAVASTSGTAIDFTGIPSWAKRVTVMFSDVSTNGVSNVIIQIGDSGGIESTTYIAHGAVIQGGAVASVDFTQGFGFSHDNSAASTLSGFFTISNISGNTWVCSGSVRQSSLRISFGAGEKTLSALLDRVRITTINGTDTFDAGTVNIMYEG